MLPIIYCRLAPFSQADEIFSGCFNDFFIISFGDAYLPRYFAGHISLRFAFGFHNDFASIFHGRCRLPIFSSSNFCFRHFDIAIFFADYASLAFAFHFQIDTFRDYLR